MVRVGAAHVLLWHPPYSLAPSVAGILAAVLVADEHAVSQKSGHAATWHTQTLMCAMQQLQVCVTTLTTSMTTLTASTSECICRPYYML